MRRLLTPLLACLVAPTLIAAAPPHSMGDVTHMRPGDKGSAARMIVYKRPQRGLPGPVQKMRLDIINACIKAKYLQLEKLALPGRKHFDFSFSGAKRPSVFWHQQEAKGNHILAKMVATLHLPYKRNGHLYVWPSAYGDNPTDKDWNGLSELYSQRDIELFKQYSGFTGMRLAIADDGDWIYAIEGD